MKYNKLLIDEKAKLLTLIKKNFKVFDFSKMISVFESNINDPIWMDVYILLFKCNLSPDIEIFDILLKKLSTPILRTYFKDNDKIYIANINEVLLSRYVWYLITEDTTPYFIETQILPKKDYMKAIFKFNRFMDAGIFIENIEEDKFRIIPTYYEFDNEDDAVLLYNKLLDGYDLFKSLKLDVKNFDENINYAIEYGKDKRMIATLSNILSYFDLKFIMKNGYITMDNLNYKITNEADADKFQSKLIDAYQFFRNVVNTEDKRDIVSEIYNRKLNIEIRKEFENCVMKIFKILKYQDLVDWIITISKESKYTLNIAFDERGIFYIGNYIITNSAEAKEFYIDYMEKKKEKLAMTLYKNNIINRIKSIWNKFRAKFVKI